MVVWRVVGVAMALACVGTSVRAQAPAWNQFRGANGQGHAPDSRPPLHFGPREKLLWKTPVPEGHSSPVIWNNLIFITATEGASGETLVTLALRRDTGQVLWRRSVARTAVVPCHPLNNPASSTPVADGDRVYAYFGSYGLVCYDHEGSTVWVRRLEPPVSKFGPATSPILVGSAVVVVLDSENGKSRLLAVDRKTGRTIWETPRPMFRSGWSTPMLFRHGAVEDLMVLGSRRLTAYDPATGAERWWAGGFCDETVGVPVAGDGLLFAGAAAMGGRGDDELDAAATWKLTIRAFDRNHDGRIQRAEMTAGFAFIQRPELPRDSPGYGLPIKDMDTLLSIFDHDHDGVISAAEWMAVMKGFEALSHPTVVAFRPGAAGDARPASVAWELQRGVPETCSLLYLMGRLYMLRDGGLLTCLAAATGAELFRERIGAPGEYIASPIAVGDRIIAASVPGVVTIIEAGDRLKVLARNDLQERIYATPAVCGDILYIRTAGRLCAFGERSGR